MTRKKKDPDMEALLRGHRVRRLKEPPAGVLAAAIALREGLSRKPGRVVAWIASLVFDSALAPAGAGVRGAATTERRLLFELRSADGTPAQLDLRLRSEGTGKVELLGQILPPWPGARAEVRAARLRRKAVLGSGGEFRIEGLPSRVETFAVAVRSADGEVVLPNVPNPASPSGSATR